MFIIFHTLGQTVDGDAVIVEVTTKSQRFQRTLRTLSAPGGLHISTQVEGNESSGAPSTRLITGNPALDGAVVGVGVGIIGFNNQLGLMIKNLN